jgi:hypothetical protein
VLLVRLKCLLDLCRRKLLHLLGSTADEGAGIEESIKLVKDGGEEGGATDAFDQIVVLSELLDVVRCLVGEDACGR